MFLISFNKLHIFMHKFKKMKFYFCFSAKIFLFVFFCLAKSTDITQHIVFLFLLLCSISELYLIWPYSAIILPVKNEKYKIS